LNLWETNVHNQDAGYMLLLNKTADHYSMLNLGLIVPQCIHSGVCICIWPHNRWLWCHGRGSSGWFRRKHLQRWHTHTSGL